MSHIFGKKRQEQSEEEKTRHSGVIFRNLTAHDVGLGSSRCTLAGASPGSTSVSGAAYIQESFIYTRSHLWRNFGFLRAFFIFFVFLTTLGMKLMKPNVEESIAIGSRVMGDTQDEESGRRDPVANGDAERTKSDEQITQEVARNETVLTFQNISYTISHEKGERKLFNDVQGYVCPGKLTALMGAPGAGKTTLLNGLAQRLNFGTITGDFLVDGRPLPKFFQRATGFAEQMDIHEPTATVREALQFSALLRQPKEVSKQEKMEYCETIIDLLEMRDIAGAIIGTVDQASKPELLMFLDEPTSGLDSGAAFNIVRFLRKLADAGQAVLCTIHLPSAVLFENFDELLLLKAGGRVVYHGPLGHDSENLINYFESNGGHKCT
ncbi:hypothetical protein HZS61_008546 [Fusarium oxysporum f. sp. conglutinans]|uniref:ABC transporter domain-containing protein n=1 Tax=Fusarium oxysporum f. sp. conglutinans TaxID=100902 RepID=A0A8H6LQ25_FUSOX|nr:hypothetical protein HZS61_008546 [Fusarium oxysporum f. sp. conglutinans]